MYLSYILISIEGYDFCFWFKSKEVLKILVLIEALCPIQQSKTYPYNFPFPDQTKTLHKEKTVYNM